MTNFERYKEQITKARQEGRLSMFIHGHLDEIFVRGGTLKDEGVVAQYFALWLQEEYKEPEVDWSTVAVDTPILVSDDGERYKKRYFAQYEYGKVFAWRDGKTSWTAYGDCDMNGWIYAKLADGDNL